MGKKSIITLIIVVIALLALGIMGYQCVGYLDVDQWGYIQAHVGDDYIQTKSGLYWKGFGTETPYNLFEEFVYSDEKGEGEFEKE